MAEENLIALSERLKRYSRAVIKARRAQKQTGG
jgi:hypothetical protein